jgi:hypothetical protein
LNGLAASSAAAALAISRAAAVVAHSRNCLISLLL